jgi:5-methylcytosine-specific restriction enzyme subunit McrC
MSGASLSAVAVNSTSDIAVRRIDGIPVRNSWLLMLYASQLFRQVPRADTVGVEDNPEDIPDLIAEILTRAVEHRLSRNLTHGYRSEQAVLNRVRGHVGMLETVTRRLLSRGAVACRFENLTVDTPRNQFVRAALEALAGVVRRPDLVHRCRVLSLRLERLGVAARRPSRAEISTERYGRHDAGRTLIRFQRPLR